MKGGIGIIMKRLKISLVLLIVTIASCGAIISISNSSSMQGFKKITSGQNYAEDGIISEEGVFPVDVNYEYAEGGNIYHIRYTDRSSIGVYNISSQKSETIVTPVNSGYVIDSFCKAGDCFIWKENSEPSDEQYEGNAGDWSIYLKEGNSITKIDGKGKTSLDGVKSAESYPGRLSSYGDYIAYKSYGSIPGTDETGPVVKFYDIAYSKLKTIFSVVNGRDIVISDPYVYKDNIAWSVSKLKYDSDEDAQGDIYLYNIKTGDYKKLTENGPFLEPVIWENYIVCLRSEAKARSIVMIDMNSGSKKELVSSDKSISPVKEVHDFMAGGGYVTWNTSYADAVNVYDILDDKMYTLKETKKVDNTDNSLLNIRLYDKMVLFTDHTFNSKNGRTISETNSYIQLK